MGAPEMEQEPSAAHVGRSAMISQSHTSDLTLPKWWIVAALGIAAGYSFGLIWRTHTQHLVVDDFVSYYAGAKALGKTPNLYDPAVNRHLQIEATGYTGPDLTFIRLPWFAVMLWPLTLLPYEIAYVVWFAVRMLAVAGFICWWPYSARGQIILVCCLSLPLAAALYNGQDVPLLLLWIGLWQKLESEHHPFYGGLALSLCLAKFNLLLLLPILLIIHRRKLTILGGAVGGFILCAISFIVQPDWPVRYLELLSHRISNPSTLVMPNIHGLLGVTGSQELVVCLLIAVLATIGMYRSDYLDGIAIALTASFLISHHAFVADGLILIPAILIFLRQPPLGRAVGFVLGCPVPWFLVWNRG